MVWSVPMTAVSGQILTASQFNASVRDNLLETAPAKATTAGSLFRDSGVNSISEVLPQYQFSSTTVTTTSTSYVPLSGGPSVTCQTGTSALVLAQAAISSSTSAVHAYVGVAISGDSGSLAPDATHMRILHGAETAGHSTTEFGMFRYTGLTPGTNTFTLNYRSGSSTVTATFSSKVLLVIPL